MIKVKPLDWRAYGNQHLSGWQGMGRMGALYYITDTGPDGEGKGGWWYKDEWFETAEAAKSAAQSDYERRVLSALSDEVNEAEERAAFETWAAEWWPNSNPPAAAWTGWLARAGGKS